MIQLLVLVENDRRGPMFDRFPYGLRYGFGSRVLQQLPQGIGQRFWVIGLKALEAKIAARIACAKRAHWGHLVTPKGKFDCEC